METKRETNKETDREGGMTEVQREIIKKRQRERERALHQRAEWEGKRNKWRPIKENNALRRKRRSKGGWEEGEGGET